MSSEQRGDKHYYYRHSWRNGRAVHTYLGTGKLSVRYVELARRPVANLLLH